MLERELRELGVDEVPSNEILLTFLRKASNLPDETAKTDGDGAKVELE